MKFGGILREDKSNIDSWLHHALGVACAIEQFHAHANYRNPHPKHKKDGTVHVDKSHRTDRSEVVQAWLTEQDRYLKVFTSSILMLIHQVQASKEGATPPFLLVTLGRAVTRLVCGAASSSKCCFLYILIRAISHRCELQRIALQPVWTNGNA